MNISFPYNASHIVSFVGIRNLDYYSLVCMFRLLFKLSSEEFVLNIKAQKSKQS